jgi:DNA-binding response OmpR family regulator
MRILIIEDEIELGNSIKSYLQEEQLICDIALDTEMAKEFQETCHYECIILDVMLPQQSGISFLTELSSSGMESKTIVISAKNSSTDRIQALNLGAIAYLVKPFHLASLKAIVQQLEIKDNIIQLHSYQINLLTKQVSFDNQMIDLNKTEIDIIYFLFLNRYKVISKNAIAEHINQNSALYYDNFTAIDYNIEHLIKKLPLLGQYLQQIHSIAYKLT